ncbi:glycoside hydrolase family 30 beta sandwich domain-containing protein [Methylomonas sp. MED-D]|uniref:glycoside hydrolase family 30 beta sandwich domain-containing protein n=1 Tax=Methylomonas sp. MED-D TaxID=3418768 RepID=UPI003D05D8B8
MECGNGWISRANRRAHAAKWVRPGSLRLETDADTLPNVAFLTPDDRIVLIVLNDTAETRDFRIRYRDLNAAASLAAGTVATYVWRA